MKSVAVSWLLDPISPGVRYLALRDLLDCPSDDPELRQAQKAAHESGPIAAILDAMQPEGFWVEPGPGYYPKYHGTVWSLITLAQLGASAALDERIATACAYVLAQTLAETGQFSVNGTPSSTADCLQGNLCAALLDLGCRDTRLDAAFEWMARSLTGEGVAPSSDRKAQLRYYAGKCGPGFACGANNKQPCAWGAVKVMLAFGKLPVERRTPLIDRAIQQGVDFLFSTDPAGADYPTGWSSKPSRNWWKFGFPVFYVTDLLQLVEALTLLGFGTDPRLANALKIIMEKQDAQGRWSLEYDYNRKCWLDFGTTRTPNPWVTLRALQILKKVSDHKARFSV